MIPKHNRARWDGNTLLNAADAPLWSGKGPPPPEGSEVELTGSRDAKGNRHRAKITHYEVEGPWLMAWGYRVADPSRKGNLAGTEIHYPEDQRYPD